MCKLCTLFFANSVTYFTTLGSDFACAIIMNILKCCYVFPCIDSGSARFKADLTARTVQARVAAGSTSQSVLGLGGPYIYNEPNKKSSIFIGNLTWVSSQQVGFK